jgi:hypothetical protein
MYILNKKAVQVTMDEKGYVDIFISLLWTDHYLEQAILF